MDTQKNTQYTLNFSDLLFLQKPSFQRPLAYSSYKSLIRDYAYMYGNVKKSNSRYPTSPIKYGIVPDNLHLELPVKCNIEDENDIENAIANGEAFVLDGQQRISALLKYFHAEENAFANSSTFETVIKEVNKSCKREHRTIFDANIFRYEKQNVIQNQSHKKMSDKQILHSLLTSKKYAPFRRTLVKSAVKYCLLKKGKVQKFDITRYMNKQLHVGFMTTIDKPLCDKLYKSLKHYDNLSYSKKSKKCIGFYFLNKYNINLNKVKITILLHQDPEYAFIPMFNQKHDVNVWAIIFTNINRTGNTLKEQDILYSDWYDYRINLSSLEPKKKFNKFFNDLQDFKDICQAIEKCRQNYTELPVKNKRYKNTNTISLAIYEQALPYFCYLKCPSLFTNKNYNTAKELKNIITSPNNKNIKNKKIIKISNKQNALGIRLLLLLNIPKNCKHGKIVSSQQMRKNGYAIGRIIYNHLNSISQNKNVSKLCYTPQSFIIKLSNILNTLNNHFKNISNNRIKLHSTELILTFIYDLWNINVNNKKCVQKHINNMELEYIYHNFGDKSVTGSDTQDNALSAFIDNSKNGKDYSSIPENPQDIINEGMLTWINKINTTTNKIFRTTKRHLTTYSRNIIYLHNKLCCPNSSHKGDIDHLYIPWSDGGAINQKISSKDPNDNLWFNSLGNFELLNSYANEKKGNRLLETIKNNNGKFYKEIDYVPRFKLKNNEYIKLSKKEYQNEYYTRNKAINDKITEILSKSTSSNTLQEDIHFLNIIFRERVYTMFSDIVYKLWNLQHS